ncbi:restriction endonuclease subunit S [Streptococcus salivarius]|uniref:restriction endonuclease subunit S n=1 Tax=Streptococcus salivarius TaxID=1304 RepID=UPI0022E11CBE|nr:restriction endonuclease subunit S [Streptococcus salivarius]
MTNSKNMPKRRFPYFEGEWEQKEFGKMCQRIQTGTTLLGCEQGKGIPLLKMGNIQRGYWDFTKLERLNQEIECENIIKYGDFLFNTRNTLELVGKGATWFIKEGLYGFNSNLARATLDDVDTIFFNYLYNIPGSIQQVKSRAVGTTSVAAIYPKDMSTIKFQLPTINEQNKLGYFFQTIDSLISLHQHKLDKLKNLKKAYLAELFPAEGKRLPKRRFPGFEGGWEEKKLGEVVEKFDNLRIPVASKDRIAGNVPYYGANGIQDYVEGFTHDGEFVLLAEDGANDLNDYPVQYVNGKVWVNNHAHVIQGRINLIDNKFLLFAIKQIQMEPYLVGGGRAKLNAEIMMNLPLTAPDIEEQRMIGVFLMKVEKQISLQQQKLDKLNDLKKAYLNELFV